MMEAARTSETSVDIQLKTWQYIPENSELHTRRHENLKCHMDNILYTMLKRFFDQLLQTSLKNYLFVMAF
jgi:hypothetical protein